MTWVRPREDLEFRFEVQREFLRASCRLYDEGYSWEALRLATTVYVLVQDNGKKSHSILSQLGIKNALTYVASGAPCVLGNYAPEVTLASMILGRGGRYVPWLSRSPSPSEFIDFNRWWDGETIIRAQKFTLTRKELTFSLRSKDGGSHLDSKIVDPNYVQITRGGVMPFTGSGTGPVAPLFGPELASMRQIAWELLITLNSWRPE